MTNQKRQLEQRYRPFEERPGSPDVGVPHAASRRLCDVLLLKQLLQRLSNHGHGVRDVSRLVLPVDQLKTQQACTAHAAHTNTHTNTQKGVRLDSLKAALIHTLGDTLSSGVINLV